MSLEPVPTGGVVAAAGTVPWRLEKDRLQVALIHRPRYDDWSWPKGKLDPGEQWPTAAVRETREETGFQVALGRPLPRSDYVPASKNRLEAKRVHYWAAHVRGAAGRLEHEVDDLAWLDPAAARGRLSYRRDHEQLDALVAAHESGTLKTRSFALVRHAKARPRKDWSKADWLRPLDATGLRQARELVPVLASYGVGTVTSSSSTRCADTVAPYAASAGLTLTTTTHLSEEGFARRPHKAIAALLRAFAEPSDAAVCTHGPLLPDLLRALVDYTDDDGVRAAVAEAAGTNLAKGEIAVMHVTETPGGPRIVDVERHLPVR